MNMPMRHFFSATSVTEAKPAPAVHEPGVSPPQGPRFRFSRWRVVAIVAVVALVAAFAAVILTRDNGGEPAAKPAPAPVTFGSMSAIVPTGANYALTDAVVGPDGSMFFAARGASNSIVKLSPSGELTTLRVPGTEMGTLAVARDGTLFTSTVTDNATSIVRLGANGANPSLFLVPSVDLGAAGKRTVFPIHAMTVANDGTLWFERGQVNRWDSGGGYTSAIGTLSASGQMNIYPVADRLYAPGGVVQGPDGSMWFSATCVCARTGWLENIQGKPALDDSGKLVVKKYQVKTGASGATGIGPHPARLAIVGNNIWFTEQQDDFATELTPAAPINGNGAIGRLTLTNPPDDGIVEYQLPTMHSRPMGITAGSDGNLWVTEAGTSKLARFDTTGKLLSEYNVPGAPDDIVTGPDGNLYFTTGGAFEWTAQTHTDGLVGNQFPAWTTYPSTVQKFVVKP